MQLVIRGVARDAVIIAASAGSLMIAGAGPAAAGEHVVSATFQYTCVDPSVSWAGSQPMTGKLSWGFVSPMMVGQHTQALGISAVASVTSVEMGVLNSFGATSVQGTAEAPVEVHAPQGDISLTVPLGVPKTSVPSSGSMEVNATGTPPVLIPSRPGDGTITAGSTLTLQLTPLNASGGPTALGTVDATCTMDAGQNPVLGSFVITPKPSTAPAVVHPTGAPVTGSKTATGDSSSPSASGNSSASGSAVVVPTVPATPPAPAPTVTVPAPAPGLFGIPIVMVLILLGLVTVAVGAVAFIAALAFVAGRRTRPREQ